MNYAMCVMCGHEWDGSRATPKDVPVEDAMYLCSYDCWGEWVASIAAEQAITYDKDL